MRSRNDRRRTLDVRLRAVAAAAVAVVAADSAVWSGAGVYLDR